MKAAFLGTHHPDVDATPEDILRDAGLTYLQELAGYIPAQTTTADDKFMSLTRLDQETVDAAMTLLSDGDMQNCNRRVPYLMLVWLLVGSDNAFRVIDYAEQASWKSLCAVAYTLLQLAMGFDFSDAHLKSVSQHAWDQLDTGDHTAWPVWADEAVAWVSLVMEHDGSVFVRTIEWMLRMVTRIAKTEATAHINKQAREWATMDDETIGLAIQFLLTDIMDFLDKA